MKLTQTIPPIAGEHQFIDDLPVAIYTCDEEGRITYFNEAAAELWGRRPVLYEDMWNGTWSTYTTDERTSEPGSSPALKNTIPACGQEIIIERPNGERRHVLSYPKPLYDEDGKPNGAVNVLADITDKKETNRLLESNEKKYRLLAGSLQMKIEEKTLSLENKIEELKKSADRYHKMIEEVRDYAIILLDIDGTILDWNQGAQNIKGYSEKEILGKNFRVFYLAEDREALLPEKLIEEAIEKGKATHEGLRVRKDKTTFWGSVVITALHDEDGQIIGFTKVTRDLTEKKKAENKLIEYAAQLEEQNKELAQYAYVTSHDLQEPLRKIQTFASIADASDDMALVKAYMSKIAISAGRMKTLIRSVLDYTSITEGERIIADTDLNEVVSNVEKDYELLIQEKGATIRYGALPVVRGIPIQLSQLFSNLINNALKFNEHQPVIDISAQTASADDLREHPSLSAELSYVKITVQDNGIGFEQKYGGQIFELFKRLNEKTKYTGTGLGLALCKKIAENHHGTISAHSLPGQGARFEILLPASWD